MTRCESVGGKITMEDTDADDHDASTVAGIYTERESLSYAKRPTPGIPWVLLHTLT